MIEFTLADILGGYLTDALAALDQPITTPVVAWYDPMAGDDADRIEIRFGNIQTSEVGNVAIGNYSAEVIIAIKTQWTQATVSDDKSTHATRVKACSDAFLTDTLFDDLQTEAADTGIAFNFINPHRSRQSSVQGPWFYTELGFTVTIYTV